MGSGEKKMARYKTVDDKQLQYVPLLLCDLFPPEHAVVQLLKLLQEKIDWTEFDNNYNNDEYGQTAFPPDRVSALFSRY